MSCLTELWLCGEGSAPSLRKPMPESYAPVTAEAYDTEDGPYYTP